MGNVYVPARSAEALAPSACSSDPGAYAVANEFLLKFRDAGKNPEPKATIRRGCVHPFMQRDELDSEGFKFREDVDDLAETPGKPVVRVHHDCIEMSLTTCREKFVEAGPSFHHAANAHVSEFGGYLPRTAPAVIAQLAELHGRILTGMRADASVQGGSHRP